MEKDWPIDFDTARQAHRGPGSSFPAGGDCLTLAAGAMTTIGAVTNK